MYKSERVEGLSVGITSSSGNCKVFPWDVNGLNNIMGIIDKLPVPHLKKGLQELSIMLLLCSGAHYD
jgi:hypothetical protein